MIELVKGAPSPSGARCRSIQTLRELFRPLFDVETLVADRAREGASVMLIPDDLLATSAMARVIYETVGGRLSRECGSPAQDDELNSNDPPGERSVVYENARNDSSMFGARNDQDH